MTGVLEVTPLVAGMEPNDLTLAASEERGGAEAGLEERGACGSAIDPNDNPAAKGKFETRIKKKKKLHYPASARAGCSSGH